MVKIPCPEGFASDNLIQSQFKIFRALDPQSLDHNFISQIRSAGLAHQAPLARAGATGCRLVRPTAVASPRCSTDANPPNTKPTRGRKKVAAPKNVAASADPLDEAAMLKLTKVDLQALAEAKGVPKSGTKAQIVARILGTEGGASAEGPRAAPAAAAAKKPRAPRKKAAAKKEEEKERNEVNVRTRAVEDPARRQAVLEGQAAAVAAATAVVRALNSKSRVLQGHQEALDVAISVSAALNAKLRVLEGQQRAIAAAIAATAAASARLRVLESQREALAAAATVSAAFTRHYESNDVIGRQQEGTNAAQDAAAHAPRPAPAASPAAAAAEPPALPPPGSRRKLSPAEATRVLEEIARRKGAVDAAATPALTEVERAREVMASLRADLEEQKRRTRQLQAVIARGAASAQLTAQQTAIAVEGGEKAGLSGADLRKPSYSGSGKAAPSNSPAMEFLGAALVAVGRALTLALSGGTKSSR